MVFLISRITGDDRQKAVTKILMAFLFVTWRCLFSWSKLTAVLPSLEGGGLVQVLVSVFTPPPHVTLHFDSDHSVYPPSTTLKE